MSEDALPEVAGAPLRSERRRAWGARPHSGEDPAGAAALGQARGRPASLRGRGGAQAGGTRGPPPPVPARVPARRPLRAPPPPAPSDPPPSSSPGPSFCPPDPEGDPGSSSLDRAGGGREVWLQLSLPLPPTLLGKPLPVCSGRGGGGAGPRRAEGIPSRRARRARRSAGPFFSSSPRLLFSARPGVTARAPSRRGPSPELPGAGPWEVSGTPRLGSLRRRRRPGWGGAAGRLAAGGPRALPTALSAARAARSQGWFFHFEKNTHTQNPYPRAPRLFQKWH